MKWNKDNKLKLQKIGMAIKPFQSKWNLRKSKWQFKKNWSDDLEKIKNEMRYRQKIKSKGHINKLKLQLESKIKMLKWL